MIFLDQPRDFRLRDLAPNRLAVSIKNCDTLKRSTSCKPMARLQLLARCRTSGSGSSLNSAKISLAALGARTVLSCLAILKLVPPFQMTCTHTSGTFHSSMSRARALSVDLPLIRHSLSGREYTKYSRRYRADLAAHADHAVAFAMPAARVERGDVVPGNA